MSSNLNLVARNSSLLAFRTVLVMIISLYSSRIVINNLGVVDYGIYGIVGSVITFWAAFRGIFASSTQRFLNAAKAEHNIEYERRVFSLSLIIHFFLALLFFIVIGMIGYWTINHKLTIPIEKLRVTNFVFFFSLLASLISIISIPYDAIIVANQKMGFFALTTVLRVFGELLIALMVPFFKIDSLLFYGVGLSLYLVLLRIFIVIYTSKIFPEIQYKWQWNAKLFKEMGLFASWNLLGNISFHVVNEGINFLLNIFYGPVVNASRTIAYQVKSAIMGFSTTVLLAADPQITQLSVKYDYDRLNALFSYTTRSIFYLTIALVFPFIISNRYILTVWLVDVPPYAIEFVSITLFYAIIRSLHGPIDSLFKGSGKIKGYQILEGSILLSSLVISYFMLRANKWEPTIVFQVMLLVEILNFFVIIFYAYYQINFNIKRYFVYDLWPMVVVFGLSYFSYLIIKEFFDSEYWFWRSLLLFLSIVLIAIYFGVTAKERKYLIQFISRKFKFDK